MSIRLTVIGGGPGGYTAAFAAARAGMSVTLVESGNLGGTCLNNGCIPTKTLKASADALELALRLSQFGITGQGVPAVDPAAEGLCAVRGCLGHEGRMDYSAVPSGIFTSPEIGCVGLTEAQASEAGRDVRTATFQMRELGKAQAMNELPGMFKIVSDGATGKVLGVHIAGAHATDLIAEAGLALRLGGSVRDIAATIHAHPTLAEGLYEAALSLVEAAG